MKYTNAVLAFATQRTTIIGAGAVVASVVGYLNHTLTADAAIMGLSGGLTMIAIPEKPSVQADVTQAVADGLAVAHTKGSPVAMAAITADMVKLSHDLPAGTPVVPVTVVTPVVAPTYQLLTPTGPVTP